LLSIQNVAKALECDYYFAYPYPFWGRGLKENDNGLLRQFCPKRSRFEEITERALKSAKKVLNRRQRKTLGYATPTEVFLGSHSERIFHSEVDCVIEFIRLNVGVLVVIC